MPESERYFHAARIQMVDGQIRPNDVPDERVITAMRTIRRERFCPPALAARAYTDIDLPLGGGRVMPAPLTIARLARYAAPRTGEGVLVVGAGTGYGAAVLASCGGDVIALEEEASLRAIAEPALATEAPDVRVLAGRLTDGAPAHAPFDLIVIEGAVETLPSQMASQLSPEGRMIAILRDGGVGRIVRAEVSGGNFAYRALADCNTALLPAFQRKLEFSF